MSTPVNLNPRLRRALGLPLLVLLSACATIGAGSVNRDRLDYAEALARSWKEQTLLNIVKLRYADTPVFLEVSSVISSYQLQSQLNLLGTLSYNLTPNLPDSLGRGATVGATGSYTDRPTITYTPLQGDKFTHELLRPIAPAALFQLVQAGYSIDLLFQLAVRAINGVYNRSTRPGWTRNADPAFYQVLDALRRLQLSEAIDFRLEKRGPEETSLITFRSSKATPTVEEDSRFVRTVLGIKPGARELNLTFGAIPRNDQELALLTRSMLEILLELGARVEAPATDVQEGSAFPVPPASPDSGPRDQPLVKIHSGAEPPENAFVTVRYSNHWFWIDNRDFRSKAAFTFLLLLTSLAQTGAVPQAPVITVPAS
ncbi:MAG TPA: hypothetical protein VES89_11905 [Candidatus Competibacteraceae bacterium]|nr:hypothetical protein [Candidatus Competibacteraceae bacterium]